MLNIDSDNEGYEYEEDEEYGDEEYGGTWHMDLELTSRRFTAVFSAIAVALNLQQSTQKLWRKSIIEYLLHFRFYFQQSMAQD